MKGESVEEWIGIGLGYIEVGEFGQLRGFGDGLVFLTQIRCTSGRQKM